MHSMVRFSLTCLVILSQFVFATEAQVYWDEIQTPNDVLDTEPTFDTDHWGVVNFEPVPPYSIDTHDPITQDVFISASVHKKDKPWDSYIWDRIASLSTSDSANRAANFVDVGANLGYFALAASSLGYNVIAFEPMSRNAKKLAKSIERNHFNSRVKLYQNVVTNTTGQQVVMKETDVSNQGNGQIISETEGSGTGIYGIDFVSSVTLSDMLDGQDAYIVKIDVEGSEGEVISGAKEWICNNIVQNIIVEISEATRTNIDFPLSEMLDFMRRAGYSMSDVAVGSGPWPGDWTDVARLPPNVIFTLKNRRPTC